MINLLNADIIGIVEAEDRIGLKAFNDTVVKKIGGQPYEHVMLIDGNDDPGIDVGIMSRSAFPIHSMRSHVDDADGTSTIFSRDCPEYLFTLPSGTPLLVMVNHLKSKGYGSDKAQFTKLLGTKVTFQLFHHRASDGLPFCPMAPVKTTS